MWAAFFVVNWLSNVLVIVIEGERQSVPSKAIWEPAVTEGSSALVSFVLLLAIIGFDRRYTIEQPRIWSSLRAHFLFTIPFSLAHVVGMVGLRKIAYAMAGRAYDFGNWPIELVYEYLKDFRSYFSMLALIYLYRFILRRLRGEAGFLSQGKEQTEASPVTDRFLVKKLGREFLVKVEDIDWIQASGNYVNLHVDGRIYPLRDTMTAIETRLADQNFARVHRSAVVNLDRIAEIVPFDTGDGQLRLIDDQEIPVSRRYRKQLRERLS